MPHTPQVVTRPIFFNLPVFHHVVLEWLTSGSRVGGRGRESQYGTVERASLPL
jgi:hypothetical protein